MAQWFTGSSIHKVDAKGRVSVPASYRRVICAGDPDWTEGLQANFFLVYGDDERDFLEGFTVQGMNQMGEQIEAMEPGSPDQMFMDEFYFNSAVTLSVDDSGRLILSKELREKVGIKTEAQFVSGRSTFQIWEPQAFAEHKARLAEIHAGHREKHGKNFVPRALLKRNNPQ